MKHARNNNTTGPRNRAGTTKDNQGTTNALIADLFRVIAEEEIAVSNLKAS